MLLMHIFLLLLLLSSVSDGEIFGQVHLTHCKFSRGIQKSYYVLGNAASPLRTPKMVQDPFCRGDLNPKLKIIKKKKKRKKVG